MRQGKIVIHVLAERRGELRTPGSEEAKPVAQFAKADDLWKAMQEGARWSVAAHGEPRRPGAQTAELRFRVKLVVEPEE